MVNSSDAGSDDHSAMLSMDRCDQKCHIPSMRESVHFKVNDAVPLPLVSIESCLAASGSIRSWTEKPFTSTHLCQA